MSRGRGSRGRGRGRGGGRGGGRGRGGSRGRGSSRGRGRGRGSYSAGATSQPANEWDLEKTQETDEEQLNIQTDLRKYFVGTASFDQHFDAQEENKIRYVAGMKVLDNNGVEISQNARVRALAAAWSRKDHNLANGFLLDKKKFGLVEVLKALTVLDSSRCIRVQEKKLKRLQLQTGGKVKPKIQGKFKSQIDNLTAIKPKSGSASGALCKHIRRWVKTFSAEELEFYALHFPAEPWKKLADICHFNPKKDFSLPWFLPYCFGEPAPEDTVVYHCKNITPENVNNLLKEFDLPYAHVKNYQSNLDEDSKAKIAATDKLDQVIWWYEELTCDHVDKVLDQRFKKEGLNELSLPYGKLMERLLTIKMLREGVAKRNRYYGEEPERIENPTKAPFYPLLVPVAQERLNKISLNLESPIVVIGDKSSSMDVAIRTSTIISSLLTAITSAKLVFFNNTNHTAQFIPTNIEEVLEMAVTIRATGSTAPAASLYPFYDKKEVVKTFVIVTDEEENTAYKGYKFLELYKKYREEVYPSRLVFVSFLRSQHETGQMVKQLERSEVPVMQFKFDQTRPDLTKLDTLFGLLSADTSSFEDQVTEMETDIKANGLHTVFDDLNMEEESTEIKDKAGVQSNPTDDDKAKTGNEEENMRPQCDKNNCGENSNKPDKDEPTSKVPEGAGNKIDETVSKVNSNTQKSDSEGSKTE